MNDNNNYQHNDGNYANESEIDESSIVLADDLINYLRNGKKWKENSETIS
jgi:hypothetical protein